MGKGLSFTIHADYSEVIECKKEIDRLTKSLRDIPKNPTEAQQSDIKKMETDLAKATAKFKTMFGSINKDMTEAQRNIQISANGITNSINGIFSSLQNPLGATPAMLGVGALGALVGQMANVHGKFQNMKAQITTMVGQKNGDKLFADLSEFAKISPLTYEATVGKAQMMLGFGIEQKNVLPYLKAISDVSMGDTVRFNSLALAFSQMSAAGKLMGQDLMQMVNAGFQPLQIISEKTGKSIGQLKDEMSKGKISAQMVQQAFLDATSAGGKFYNMSETASKTIPGKMSMIEDAISALFDKLGTTSEPVIMKVLDGTIFLINNIDRFKATLMGVIAALGLFKVTQIAAKAAEKKAAEDAIKTFEDECRAAQEVEEAKKRMDKAISDSYDNEIRKADELKKRKSEGNVDPSSSDKGASQQPMMRSAAPVGGFSNITKGARYNAEVTDEILNAKSESFANKAGNTEKLASLDKEIALRKENIKTTKELIAQDEKDLAVVRKKLDALDDQEEESIITDTHDKKKDVFDYRRQKLKDKERDAGYSIDAGRSFIDSEQKELDNLLKKREELSKPIELAAKMDGSGSADDLKSRLATLKDIKAEMSPDELDTEFGKKLEGQIKGLEAAAQGLVNLDSDIAENLNKGLLSEDRAQEVQCARNELEDSVKSTFESISTEGGSDAFDNIADSADKASESVKQTTDAVNNNTSASESNSGAVSRNTASTNLNTNAEQSNTNAERSNTNAEKENSRATNDNTNAVDRNSAAEAKAGIITKALTGAKHMGSKAWDAITRSVKGYWAALMANPLGMILGAVTLVSGLIFDLYSNEKEAEKEANKFADETAKNVRSVETMYAVLENTDKKSRTYKDTLAELTKQAKEYGIQIKEEGDVYKQLIAAKERMIALIKEEGEQRRLASHIEDYQNKISQQEKEFTEELTGALKRGMNNSENAEMYAKIIAESLTINADEIMRLEQQAQDLVSRMINAQKRGAKNESKALDDELKKVREKWDSLVYGSARESAANNGEILKFESSLGSRAFGTNKFGNMSSTNIQMQNFAKSIAQSNNQMTQFTNAATKSKDATKKLADETEKVDYKKMDPTALNKALTESIGKVSSTRSELAEFNKTSAKGKVDTSGVDSLISKIEKAQKSTEKTNKTSIGPKNADTEATETVTTAAKETKQAADDVSDTTIAPKSDTTEIEGATSKTEQLKGEQDKVNSTTATPKISTNQIDRAILQMDTLLIRLKAANGAMSNGFLSAQDAKTLQDVKAKLKFENGLIIGHKNDIALYKQLSARAKANSEYNGEFGKVNLSQAEAQYWMAIQKNNPQAFSEKDGKRVFDINKVSEEWKKPTQAFYQKQKKKFLNAEKVKAEVEYRKGLQAVKDQIESAKTREDAKKASDMIKGLRDKVEIDSKEDKELKKLEEKIKKKTQDKKKSGTAKTKEEQEQETWQSQRKKAEDALKMKRQIIDREFKLEEERVKLMDEGYIKRRAQIDLNHRKEVMDIKRNAEDLAKTLEDRDRELWKLDHKYKNPKGKSRPATDAMWEKERLTSDKDPATYSEYLKNLKTGETAKTEDDYYAGLSNVAKSKAWYAKVAKERGGTSDLLNNLDAKTQKELTDILKEQSSALNDFLAQYGSYEAKLSALKSKLEEEISKAEKSGDMVGVMSAQRKYSEDVNALKGEELMKGIDWQTVFSDYENYATDFLEETKRQLQAFLDANRMSIKIEDAEKLINQINSLDSAIKGRKTKFFGDVVQGGVFSPLIESQKRKEEVAVARKDYEEKNKIATAANLKYGESKLDVASYLQSKGIKYDGEIDSKNAGKILEASGNDSVLASKLSAMTGSETKAVETSAIAKQAGDKLAGLKGGGGGGFAMTDAIIHGVNDNLQSFKESMEILNIQNTKFGKGMGKFIESSGYATAAFDAFKKGDFVGVANNLSKAFGTLGEAMGRWGISGFGASDNDILDAMVDLANVNESLRRAISELTQNLSTVNFGKVEDEYKTIEKFRKQDNENTAKLMRGVAAVYNQGFIGIGGASSGLKKVDKELDAKAWQDISMAAKTSVRSAGEFFNLTSEQMYNVSLYAPVLYDKIKRSVAEGYQDASIYMDDYIQQWKQADEQLEAYVTRLSGLSFDDMVSGFESMIGDMSSSWADFSDNISDTMRNAILKSLVTSAEFETKVKTLRGMIKKAMESDSDEGKKVTRKEIDTIRDYTTSMLKEYQDEMRAIDEALGFDSSYSQRGATRDIKSVTTDQATEISGRMTAIAVSVSDANIKRTIANDTLGRISDAALKTQIATSDALVPQIASLGEQVARCAMDIAGIRENTEALVKPIKTMSKDINEMKDTIKKFNL